MPKYCIVCGKTEERHTVELGCNFTPAEVERVTRQAALPATAPCPAGACAHDEKFHQALMSAPKCVVPGCGCTGQAS